jgi:hypothetical protein
MAENPTCVITIRPKDGKFPEVGRRLSQDFTGSGTDNLANIAPGLRVQRAT